MKAQVIKTTKYECTCPNCGHNIELINTRPPKATLNTISTHYNINIQDISFIMRYIPAGSFIMGSPANELGREDDEVQHKVTISKAFYMGETEVTQELWQAVIGNNPAKHKGSKRPVERVSWCDCHDFIQKLNSMTRKRFRLPTEAEWEYACRAGTQTALYTGKNLTTIGSACPNLDEVAWYSENSDDSTHPVKLKKPNAWGLYDMLGNVWEWCDDRYGSYTGDAVDPRGTGSDRVIRGGSCHDNARYCRAAYRSRSTPDCRSDYSGFRLVLDI
jgi:formylglycine-generating enzyme required for sulfatase activity